MSRRATEDDINKVEVKIEKVEKDIEKVAANIEKETDAEEKKALRKEKEQLRKEKEQLRDEKKQLREEKNMLLQQQQQQQQPYAGRPPRTPTPTKQMPPVYAPPSAGTSAPKKSKPRKAPSSDEGQHEGLAHVSDGIGSGMNCSSSPVCVLLLRLLENALQDAQKETLDNKFKLASCYVLKARSRMSTGKLPVDIRSNERFFTGAMANAMNTVIGNDFTVLHQACLGMGTTHSDLSACRIKDCSWPSTLMVGEGKWNAGNLRDETRGQTINELLRHRAIDGSDEFAPILLLAFDNKRVDIDLAFPSTKGGKLASDGVVNFPGSVTESTETFWTVCLLRMSIEDANGSKNLPIIFRFISDSLKALDELPQKNRVQFKMPIPLTLNEVSQMSHVATFGENVTVLSNSRGSQKVYKEYCYHLREASDSFVPFVGIPKSDQRLPPPQELLGALGIPYTDWTVNVGPFGMSVLSYDFIEGTSDRPSVKGWVMILKQVKAIHSIEFVHGDLLPRNVLFREQGEGFIIDFDLSRKEGELYVVGYNNADFKEYRHSEARMGEKMKKEHDVHSLRQMSKQFFDLRQTSVDNCSIDELITFFEDCDAETNANIIPCDGTSSGSPIRSTT